MYHEHHVCVYYRPFSTVYGGEDEGNDSAELDAALKDGTDDIEQGFDLDEDDAAVVNDETDEKTVEAPTGQWARHIL